jgi:hypothetical protein
MSVWSEAKISSWTVFTYLQRTNALPFFSQDNGWLDMDLEDFAICCFAFARKDMWKEVCGVGR